MEGERLKNIKRDRVEDKELAEAQLVAVYNHHIALLTRSFVPASGFCILLIWNRMHVFSLAAAYQFRLGDCQRWPFQHLESFWKTCNADAWKLYLSVAMGWS